MMQHYVNKFFEPAFRNIARNLGAENVDARLVDDVCVEALEQAAKSVFTFPKSEPGESSVVAAAARKRRKRLKSRRRRRRSWSFPELTDLILISKTGRPIRREGPQWDPKRLSTETLFILGSKATRVLGYGARGRGRLFIKHPSMLRYRCDRSDKEWLLKNRYISNAAGKSYLMVLQDVAELTEKEKKSELRGFRCPPFLLRKMREFVRDVRTDPEVTDEELLLQAHSQVCCFFLRLVFTGYSLVVKFRVQKQNRNLRCLAEINEAFQFSRQLEF